jgi:superfamily I DNA/RNA helicase
LGSWIENLNPEQKQAALHDSGPMLILAGAGSGKTTVLVARTGRMIEEKVAEAKRICVLTFTNKAAKELKSRVTDKLGSIAKDVWAGTFHSFGLQILKQFHKEAELPKGFGILDSGDSQSLVKELLKDFKMAEKADFDSGKLISKMSDWRAKEVLSDDSDDPYSVASSWLLPKYIRRMTHLGLVDFDGLLLKPLELFKTHPEIEKRIQDAFSQIMVDEFQDTNKTQMALVTKLSEVHENITVVGDDDQSIYGWRGACIDNILKFPKLYKSCVVVRLERNYRSTPEILNLANAIIIKNEKRHDKILKPHQPIKSPSGDGTDNSLPEIFVYETEDEETEKVADDIESHIKDGFQYKNIAILFRSNGQGALFEAELKRRNIPHEVTGGTGFFERREIKDVLAYLRCSIYPNEVALRRIINTPNRGLGETSIDKLTLFANENKTDFYSAAIKWKEAGLSSQAGDALEKFFKDLKDLAPSVLRGTSHPSTSIRLLEYLNNMGYKQFIEKHSKDQGQVNQKWRLIEIFGNVLDKFIQKGGSSDKTLREFLNAMELHDTEEDDEKNKNSVQLLTLHGCKGLEFPIVYLVGIEEEILPHRTLGTDISEERRLFYVGVTRAQKKIFLSRARQRKRFGKLTNCAPSRFLLELPTNSYKEYELGWRPISTVERKDLLANLYKKIEAISNDK